MPPPPVVPPPLPPPPSSGSCGASGATVLPSSAFTDTVITFTIPEVTPWTVTVVVAVGLIDCAITVTPAWVTVLAEGTPLNFTMFMFSIVKT